MDWPQIIAAVGTLLGVVLLPFALKWRSEANKAKADGDGRERTAYQDGIASLSPRIEALEKRNAALEKDNLECEKLTARLSAVVEFQEKRAEAEHKELVAQGVKLGAFLAMPADLRAPVADPEEFARRESEYTEKVIGQATEAVKEEVKKVLPPEPPR